MMTGPRVRSSAVSAQIKVHLKRGRSKPFWVGHPWVFSGAIHKIEGTVGDFGGPCLVLDERANVLGAGHYNPHSKIAVRILEHRRTTDVVFDPRSPLDLIGHRIDAAAHRRTQLGLPSSETTVYRLVNAEGDLLTGLIVDMIGSVAVMQTNSRAMYDQREALAAHLMGVGGITAVVGVVTEDTSRIEAVPTGREVLSGDVPDSLRVMEAGVHYEVNILAGQKTGFYADQRDNRQRFARLCGGQDVLDLYAYTGGFGLQALHRGARSVTAVDASQRAIDVAANNAVLNGFDAQWQGICADAMTVMKEHVASGQRWTRIICDPPKLARARGHVNDAIKKYARINTLALNALEPGGLLLTCSCSQHISDEVFLRMLTDAGHRLRRAVHVLDRWSQAPDHPFVSAVPEGADLTAMLVTVEAR